MAARKASGLRHLHAPQFVAIVVYFSDSEALGSLRRNWDTLECNHGDLLWPPSCRHLI